MLASSNRQEKIAHMFSTKIKMIKERYPYSELEIEHDMIHKLMLIKTNTLIDFTLFWNFLVFWSNFHGGALIREGGLIQN